MIDKIKNLSDSIIRKFIDVIDLSWWEIESDQGWSDVKSVNKTIKYEKYIIKFKSGNILECADNHILIDENYNEVFAKDSLHKSFLTNYGSDEVIEVVNTNTLEHMYDFSLGDDTNHLFYTNGILSHNSTLMTIVAMWTALFFDNQTIAIIANKQSTATEIFDRVRMAFLDMDNWMKGGICEFNKTYMTLANQSRIVTSATSPDAIRGFSLDVLLIDEFAIIPAKDADAFWAAVTPTLATRLDVNPNAKLIVASTPKGIGNKFHDIVTNGEVDKDGVPIPTGETGKNGFAVEKAMWYDVPGRSESFKDNEVSTMGLEKFQQEYECAFLSNAISPFKESMFKKFTAEMKEPISVEEDDEYEYLKWSEPSPDRIYTMGVDTSEGVNEDYSVIQVFDITNPLEIEQAARWSSNKIDNNTFALIVRDIAAEWHLPIMAVERNGPGTTVADNLYKEWYYPRFINYGAKERGVQGRNTLAGVLTNNVVKLRGVQNMKFFVHDKLYVKIYDERTIAELRTYRSVRTSSNNYKWQAADGFHDDHVAALVWALFPLYKPNRDAFLNIKEVVEDYDIPSVIEYNHAIIDNYLYRDPSESKSKINDLRDNPFMGIMAFKAGSDSHQLIYSTDAEAQEFFQAGWMAIDEYNERKAAGFNNFSAIQIF